MQCVAICTPKGLLHAANFQRAFLGAVDVTAALRHWESPLETCYDAAVRGLPPRFKNPGQLRDESRRGAVDNLAL